MITSKDIESLGYIRETDYEKAFNCQWGGSSELFYKPYYSEIHKKELHRWIRCAGYDGKLSYGSKGVFTQISIDFRGWIKTKDELEMILKMIGHE